MKKRTETEIVLSAFRDSGYEIDERLERTVAQGLKRLRREKYQEQKTRKAKNMRGGRKFEKEDVGCSELLR